MFIKSLDWKPHVLACGGKSILLFFTKSVKNVILFLPVGRHEQHRRKAVCLPTHCSGVKDW